MPDWIVAFLRMIQFAGAAVLFGTPLFFVYARQRAQYWHGTLIIAALAALTVAAIFAALAQTALLTGSWIAAFSPADVWWYLTDTRIGRITLARFGVIAGYVVVTSFSSSSAKYLIQAVLGGAILGSFAWTGHGTEDGSLRTVSDVTHLLMAGIWVGALIPLYLAIKTAKERNMPPIEVSRGLDAFSRIGLMVIVLLVASGIVNTLSTFDIAKWPAVIQTDYGLTLLAKIAILSAMLAIAAANRYRFAPALRNALGESRDPTTALGILHRSLTLETAFAIVVLGLAAHLGSIEPPGY